MRYVTCAALTMSVLLCCLRAATYVCDDPPFEQVSPVKLQWEHRKFYRAWDWPFLLTALEFAAYYGSLRSYVLHSAVLAVRTAGQMVACLDRGCPDAAFSQLECSGVPCCGNATDLLRSQVWASPNSMCPMPKGYRANECAPLRAVPDLTLCAAWGCSTDATPLDSFVVQWQTGTSAFLAVWYLFIADGKV